MISVSSSNHELLVLFRVLPRIPRDSAAAPVKEFHQQSTFTCPFSSQYGISSVNLEGNIRAMAGVVFNLAHDELVGENLSFLRGWLLIPIDYRTALKSILGTIQARKGPLHYSTVCFSKHFYQSKPLN